MTKLELIIELREGFSKQAKQANRYWLILMFLSIISLLNLNSAENTISLPFSLGTATPIIFNFFILLMICGVSVIYTSSFLQAQRTRKLIQKTIDSMGNAEKFIEGIHVQDLFDSTVSSMFNRVGPIGQFIQGKNQFFGEDKPEKNNRNIGIFLYVLLKILTLLVIFIVPLLSIIIILLNHQSLEIEKIWDIHNSVASILNPVSTSLYFLFGITSISLFLIMIKSDFNYTIKVIQKLRNKEKKIKITEPQLLQKKQDELIEIQEKLPSNKKSEAP